MIEVTEQDVRTSCGQWCHGRRSLWIGNIPVELSLRPEGPRWSGQYKPEIKVMLGTGWQQIAPPVLDGRIPWVGTYAPDAKDDVKQEQIVAALDRMQEYAADWVARKSA